RKLVSRFIDEVASKILAFRDNPASVEGFGGCRCVLPDDREEINAHLVFFRLALISIRFPIGEQCALSGGRCQAGADVFLVERKRYRFHAFPSHGTHQYPRDTPQLDRGERALFAAADHDQPFGGYTLRPVERYGFVKLTGELA